MKKAIILAFVSLTVFFIACRKEMERPYWDTEMLAPLVNASMNINNILPDSILQANADSSMKIVFEGDIYHLDMDTLFHIPDTTIHNGYGLPSPVPFSPSQSVPFPSTSSTTYSLPGVQLRKVIIKSGHVNFKVSSRIREVTHFIYSIPCATLPSGAPFTVVMDVPARVGSTPGVYDQDFDLSGCTFDMTGPAHNTVNTIYTSLAASISASAPDTVMINPGDSLLIDNTFSDILPFYALGYFGNNTYNVGPATTDFTMFNRIVDGTIQLEDVNFDLQLINPIGMDSRVYINNLTSVNSRTGNSINLVNSVVGAPININRASESGGYVYPTFADYPLNTSNSNIKPMIENLPDKFGYSMQIITNPLGNVSGSNDFVYADKLMQAKLNMEIPLSLITTNLTLVDTFNVDLSSTNGTENIHDGTLTLVANNGFPFDASIQLYMLDEHNNAVDSLYMAANTIDNAPLNSSLRVIGKKLTKLVTPVSESKMKLLYSSKKVKLKVKFNTASQSQYIKIYSDYGIDIKLVGDINYTIHLQ